MALPRLLGTTLPNLDIGFREGDHLGKYLGHVEILHFVPLARPPVKDVCPVSSFPRARLSFVNYIGNEVIDVGALSLGGGCRSSNQVTQVDVFYREVDDGGVLLNKEGVFGESLDVQDEVGGQGGELKALECRVLVRPVFLLAGPIELGQDREERNLQFKEIRSYMQIQFADLPSTNKRN